jgi:uncharacterized protein YutE (UPF0331/DUF86 family)
MPVNGDVLKARISDLRSTLNELERLTSKPFNELSIDERYSMRYNIVVLVESLVSLCMHIAVEAYGRTPESYRDAARIVAERMGVTCLSDLESLIGLRNLLIHRYWVVEDEKVYKAAKANFRCVLELVGKVEGAFEIGD